MRVAVVGTGIAGMVAAQRLAGDTELTVYEAADRVGGHTNTIDVEAGGRPWAVDTGFLVFNERTYPHFCALLRELGVAWQPSDMSFAVTDEASGLEYGSSSWNEIFAQRKNLVRPSFWRMLREIARFYREAPAVLEEPDPDRSLGAWLDHGGYSRAFQELHLLPMVAAVWSSSLQDARTFPVETIVRFFQNHGFLELGERPAWLAIRGGSREYARALTAPFRDRVRLGAPVVRLRRAGGDVELTTRDGRVETFERVVVAAHADSALRMLADPSDREREVLGAFRFARNETVLHTDTRILPRSRRAWSSWNARVPAADPGAATVTYWMNRLQGLEPGAPNFCVTLNQTARIDPARVLRRIVYHHPQLDAAAVRAQARHDEIDGRRGVHFCGAYWGYGFHEDGVRSARAVLRNLGRDRELVA